MTSERFPGSFEASRGSVREPFAADIFCSMYLMEDASSTGTIVFESLPSAIGR